MGKIKLFFYSVNILGHLIIFHKNVKGYNPGVLTALLMIPFLIFAFKLIIDQNVLNTAGYVIAFIIGIISGVSLPITGSNLRKKALKLLQ